MMMMTTMLLLLLMMMTTGGGAEIGWGWSLDLPIGRGPDPLTWSPDPQDPQKGVNTYP